MMKGTGNIIAAIRIIPVAKTRIGMKIGLTGRMSAAMARTEAMIMTTEITNDR
jgi:hypothetical protein